MEEWAPSGLAESVARKRGDESNRAIHLFSSLARRLFESGIVKEGSLLSLVKYGHAYGEQFGVMVRSALSEDLAIVPRPFVDTSTHWNEDLDESAGPLVMMGRFGGLVSALGGLILRRSRYQSEFLQTRRLGRGGYGTVYVAMNHLDGREYAVKKIRLRHVRFTTQWHEKVMREVKTLALLHHRNVVRYYQAWVECAERTNKPVAEVKEKDEALAIRPMARLLPVSPGTLEGFQWSGDKEDGAVSDVDEDDDLFDESSGDGSDSSASPYLVYPGTAGLAKNRSDSQQLIVGDAPVSMPLEVTLYLQMELCDGDLHQWIQSPPDDPLVRLDILRQLASAVAYLHSLGLIHRDIKPSNVFLNANHSDVVDDADWPRWRRRWRSPFIVKLGDFGLAKYVGQQDFFEPQTPTVDTPLVDSSSMHTAGLGTPTYSSPEQLFGRGYGERTDLFSLGMIVFEMFCCPFATSMERAKALETARRGDLPSDFAKSHPQAASLVQALVSHDPMARPSAVDILRHPLLRPLEVAMGVSCDAMDEERRERREILQRLAQQEAIVAQQAKVIASLRSQLK